MDTRTPRENQISAFDRPQSFWLERAAEARRKGDLIKALTLLRHACQIDPSNGDALLDQAYVLWKLDCYEASFRECCRALAWNPQATRAYGLMYHNLMELERFHEGKAALENYMSHISAHPKEINLWDEQELYPVAQEKRFARRFNGLLRRISRALEKNDISQASRLLALAHAGRFPEDAPMRDMLEAQLLEKAGLTQEAAEVAKGLLTEQRLLPEEAAALCPMLLRLGERAAATGALLFACAAADTPRSVYFAMQTALAYGQYSLAMDLLMRQLEQRPDRLPLLYDMAVLCLRQGDLLTARDYITRCHEIDPYDPDVHYLFQMVGELMQEDAPVTVEAIAREMPLYAAPMSFGRLFARLQVDRLLMSHGVEEFAVMLQKEPELQRQFLSALQDRSTSLEIVLAATAACMDGIKPAGMDPHLHSNAGRAMLRMALMTINPSPVMEDVIIKTLLMMGAEPPFLVLSDGGMRQVSSGAPEPQPKPRKRARAGLRKRQLMKRLDIARQFYGHGAVIPYALSCLSRMSFHQRNLLITDAYNVFPMALGIALSRKMHSEHRPLYPRGFTPEAMQEMLRQVRLLEEAGRTLDLNDPFTRGNWIIEEEELHADY
ncbi:MAG: hypothetical protein E7319_04835 [Clostridiales bacterium]|nr:hypothetical protein [Clostridiales bacterium]